MTQATPSSAASLDRVLGVGPPWAALHEIYGAEARNAGTVSGFALASLTRGAAGRTGAASAQLPLLWNGSDDLIAETGFPYSSGVASLFGIPHRMLLFARTASALGPGEAAGLSALAAIVLEIHGNPRCLELTATRRLHRRARPPLRSVFGFPPRLRIRAKSSAGRWPVHSARPPLALQSIHAWPIRAENSYWNGTRMNNASTSDDQRIISLWLPHLPTDRIVRRRFGRSWRSNPASAAGQAEQPPLAISHDDRNARRARTTRHGGG